MERDEAVRGQTGVRPWSDPRLPSSMPVGGRHAEPVDRFLLEIELDQDGGLVPDDPAIVAWVYGNDLRGLALERAAIGILDVKTAARQEPDVRMHAQVSADDRLHVDGPAE